MLAACWRRLICWRGLRRGWLFGGLLGVSRRVPAREAAAAAFCRVLAAGWIMRGSGGCWTLPASGWIMKAAAAGG